MKTVAIIPARSGSKSIPDKNFVRINNKPLITYSIDCCLNVSLISDVVVSTDSEAYRNALDKIYGSKILTIDRSEEAASDEATSEMAVIDALSRIKYYDITCLVQCTSPFTEPGDMTRLIKEVRNNGKESSTFYTDDYHYFREVHDLKRMTKWLSRQERIPLRRIAGNAWAFRTPMFLKQQRRLFGDIGYVKIDDWKTLEIDNFADIYMADGLVKMLKSLLVRF